MFPPVELEPMRLRLFDTCAVEVELLRLDQIHPQISGNKWFKLRPFLEQAACQQQALLSFGGAHSNHIHALAWAGQQEGIATLGIIRGEQADELTPTLKDAVRWGMQLHFVSRSEYRTLTRAGDDAALSERFGPALRVPEGGSAGPAVRSCQAIWQLPVLQGRRYDYLFCALGTGGTLAGLIAGKPDTCHIVGVPALKISAAEAGAMVTGLLQQAGLPCPQGWEVLAGPQRYAQIGSETARMLLEARWHGIALDPVYTAVVLGAMNRVLLSGRIPRGSRILMLHTGGLQGLRAAGQRIMQRGPAFQGPLPL